MRIAAGFSSTLRVSDGLCGAAAINHKDGTQLDVVYNDPVEGTVYLTDIFGNTQSWIEARIAKLTQRWVDPGTGQVHTASFQLDAS